MMRSLYSGVTGLKTHQIKMDVIGNNIANVNTVAYKSSSITFNELMYQTTQKASGPNATTGAAGTNARQIGLGVKSGAINTNITSPGATQTTGNPFDLKITGDAFFIVNKSGQNYFTRDGSFYVDAAGNLATTSNGYNVMGWQADEATQTIKKDTVTALKIMSAANMTYPPEETTKATISGILDKNDKNVNNESGRTVSVQFYDNLGYSYNAKISFHATANDGTYYMQLDDVVDSTGKSLTEVYGVSNITDIVEMGTAGQTVTMSDTGSVSTSYADATNKYSTTFSYAEAAGGVGGGTATYTITSTPIAGGTPTTRTVTVTVDANGTYNPTSFSAADYQQIFGEEMPTGAAIKSINTKTGAATTNYSKTIDGGILSFAMDDKGTLSSVNGSGKTIDLKFNGAAGGTSLANFSNINIDLSETTRYDNGGTSTLAGEPGDADGLGKGRKLGAMSGIAIQTDGAIYASYDNDMTKLLGQIAVAEFANASGLEKAGDNLYSATSNSGDFDGVGKDVGENGGYMQTGVLEMSNVDLSTEFTELITTQRGFQANSRIITNSDTMLEELVNLKR